MFEFDISQFIQKATNNEIFAGLILTGAIGYVMFIFREVPRKLFQLFLLKTSTALNVSNLNSPYEWMNRWLESLNYTKDSRRLELLSDFKTRWKLVPGFGLHFIYYKNSLLLISKTRDKETTLAHQIHETINVRLFGLNSRRKIEELVSECYNFSCQENMNKVVIEIRKSHSIFRMYKEKKNINSIVLESRIFDSLIDDVYYFLNNRHKFDELGLNYKRGYLFYGKPGNGKSSLIFCLASYFNLNIYYIMLSDFKSDTELFEVINVIEDKGSIIVFEDIDAINVTSSSNRKIEQDNKNLQTEKDKDVKLEIGGITLSGLLNSIDGILSPENCIFIFTTNYPDKIDPALLRPGRVDKKIKFDDANGDMVKRMFEKFYPENSIMAENLKRSLGDNRLCSMAELQEILLTYKNSKDSFNYIKSIINTNEQEKIKNFNTSEQKRL